MKLTNRQADLMFYIFDQNNSGGVFVLDKDAGITHYVIVEASCADEANAKAEAIGIYFNGVDAGLDCECCGDRWRPVDQLDCTKTPKVYSTAPSEYVKEQPNGFRRVWLEDGWNVCVHYADGRKKWY